jgi:glutaredoxin
MSYIRRASFLVFCFSALLFLSQQRLRAEQAKPRLLFFYTPACSSCQKVINEFMPLIEKRFKDKIEVEYHNIEQMQDYKLLLILQEKYGSSKDSVPTIFMQGRFLSSQAAIEKNWEKFISASLKMRPVQTSQKEESLPSVNLIMRFKSFSPLAICLAGLADGINPCAFSVMVFFVAFLALQKYRRREIAITSLSFIGAVFLVYLLLGVGLLNFFYQIKGLYFLRRLLYTAVAFLCFGLGILSLADMARFKRTGSFEGMALQLPRRIKGLIQRLIGLYYRKREQADSLQTTSLKKINVFRLVLIAFGVGFIVSILEAVCTGQIYLPTITFVLKVSGFKMQALLYLLLYNLMFIMPLFAVFLFAFCGTTSEGFAQFMRRHFIIIRLLSAVLFFTLGTILIVR